MCDIDFDGYCDVWQERPRKARKQHKCNTCGRQIAPGETYVAHFSIFEGETNNEKICAECEADRSEFTEAHHCQISPSGWIDYLIDCHVGGDEGEKWKPMIARYRERRAAVKSGQEKQAA